MNHAKKFLWITGSVLFLLSGLTVFAMTVTHFTDESQFADWYKSSALKMKSMGIMNGYDDGRFGPNDPVTRAQLAVMFDRYSGVSAVPNNSGSTDLNFENKMQLIIDEILSYQNSNIDFKTPVIMAEAGLKQMTGPPNGLGSSIVKVTQDPRGKVYVLPAGYEVYEQEGIIFSYYLHYKGERAEGDVMMQRDQWYGPF